MKYQIRLDGQFYEVTLTRRAQAHYEVVTNPEKRALTAVCRRHQKSITVELEGRIYDLIFHGSPPHYHVMCRGFEHTVAISSGTGGVKPRPSSLPPPRTGLVLSPIPGRVVEILVKPGDRVSEGDAMIVLEAMKMQNQIFCPHDGIIEEIMVKKGQTVEGAAPLIKVGA